MLFIWNPTKSNTKLAQIVGCSSEAGELANSNLSRTVSTNHSNNFRNCSKFRFSLIKKIDTFHTKLKHCFEPEKVEWRCASSGLFRALATPSVRWSKRSGTRAKYFLHLAAGMTEHQLITWKCMVSANMGRHGTGTVSRKIFCPRSRIFQIWVPVSVPNPGFSDFAHTCETLTFKF